jgi:hypothetical protein
LLLRLSADRNDEGELASAKRLATFAMSYLEWSIQHPVSSITTVREKGE